MSIPNQDLQTLLSFLSQFNSVEFKLGIEQMNLTAESEGWKVILHPNIKFGRLSGGHDLTNHSRE